MRGKIRPAGLLPPQNGRLSVSLLPVLPRSAILWRKGEDAHMKITVEHMPVAENEVVLRCPALDEEMLRVLSLLRSSLQKLCVWNEERQITLLSPSEVLYCESVEERTFVYTAQAVLQTALGLAELESRFSDLGLFRVGKSALANLYHIRTLSSQPGGRIEATLETGERLVVSRHYAPLLRERLGL